MMIKKLKNQDGLTLTELIISMAIFAIISISFLQIFSSSLMITIRAGNRETAVVDSTGVIDLFFMNGIDTEVREMIRDGTYSSSSNPITDDPSNHVTNVIVTEGAPAAITIRYESSDPGGAREVDLDGVIIEITAEVNSETVTVKGFEKK